MQYVKAFQLRNRNFVLTQFLFQYGCNWAGVGQRLCVQQNKKKLFLPPHSNRKHGRVCSLWAGLREKPGIVG
jgi:hypothetical protein